MPYRVVSKKSGKTYYLHAKEVALAGGRLQKIHFFSSSPENSIDAVPAGYEVIENERTGLPMLRKKK